MKVEIKDVIAIFVLLVLFSAKYFGMNGMIDTMIALVIGYYFARRKEING